MKVYQSALYTHHLHLGLDAASAYDPVGSRGICHIFRCVSMSMQGPMPLPAPGETSQASIVAGLLCCDLT